jgi:hypothetical protein
MSFLNFTRANKCYCLSDLHQLPVWKFEFSMVMCISLVASLVGHILICCCIFVFLFGYELPEFQIEMRNLLFLFWDCFHTLATKTRVTKKL